MVAMVLCQSYGVRVFQVVVLVQIMLNIHCIGLRWMEV
jgi:hypothetical protein